MVASVGPPVLDGINAAFIQGPVSIGIGSGDLANLPSLARSIGCRVSSDRRRVTVFVVAARAETLLRDLRAGRPISAVFTRPSTHETIQLKGIEATVASAAKGDAELLRSAQKAITAELLPLGHDPRFVAAALPVNAAAMAAITFSPAAAFTQTPGPGAGRRLGAC